METNPSLEIWETTHKTTFPISACTAGRNDGIILISIEPDDSKDRVVYPLNSCNIIFPVDKRNVVRLRLHIVRNITELYPWEWIKKHRMKA